LLDGTWAAAAGGDWNTAANWVGGVVPTSGAIVIAGLNPGASVTFASGTASIASLSVTGTLNITGGSMTVTGAGSTIAAGSTLSVVGGTFNLTTTGSLLNQGTIAIGAGGMVNVRNGTLESRDAQIQLVSTAALNVERTTSGQSPILWLNSTTAPPQTALTASGSSTITLGTGGLVRIASSVVLTGTAGFVQTGGTLSFEAITNPGASPAPQNGFINALASTRATALDLQAGLMTGTGYISYVNASLGVTMQPGGSDQGTLEFKVGTAGTTTFTAGARLDVQFFNGSYDSVIFTSAAGGTVAHQIVINDLEIVASTTAGFTFPEGNGFAARVLGFDGITATITGAVTQMNPLTPTVTGLYNPNFGLMPAVAAANLGVSYVSRHMDLNVYYLWVGPANGDWHNPANWKTATWDNPEAWSYGDIFASWFFNPPTTATTAPTFFSNVVIPDSGSPNFPGFTFGNPAAFTGYAYLNSLHLMPGNQLNVQSGQLYLRGHAFTGDPGNSADGLKMIRSSLQGTTNITGGTISNHTIMEIGMESAGLGGATGAGGRLVVASGATLIIYRSTDFSGGTVLTIQSGARLEILGVTVPTVPAQPGYSGSLNLGTQSLLIPLGATLRAAAITLTASTVTIAGNLELGLVYESAGTGTYSYLFGTLAIQGNLVLTSTSATEMIIASNNNADSDRITVSGNATLAGSLTVESSPFYGISQSGAIYAILSVGGTITGAFTQTTLAPALGINATANLLEVEVSINSPGAIVLQNNLSPVADLIRQMVAYFNLTSASGDAFNLPVAGSALDTMFGLSASSNVTGFTLPTFNAAGTNQQLYDELIAAGYTVDAIAGGGAAAGLSGAGASLPDVPFGSGVFIQVRRTGTLLDEVGLAGSYSGPQFNTISPGLLQGLAATNTLNGILGWVATLSYTIVFGLKATGEFFLQRDTMVALALEGAGSISGTFNLAGQSTAVTGTTAANLTVTAGLNLSGFITYEPLSSIVAGLPASIGVAANGTASVDLTATLGPAALTYELDYAVAGFTDGTTVTTPTSSLSVVLTLPGVATSDPTPVPTTVLMSGSYDSVANSWTLTASTNALTFHGLSLNGFLNLTLSPTAFVGSGTFFLGVSFIKGGSNPAATSALNLTTTVAFTTTGATLTGTRNVANMSTHTETGSTLLAATTTTSLVTNIAIDFATAATTGGFTLQSVSGSVLPDAKYESLVSDTNADGAAFTVTYGIVSHVLTVTLDRLTVTFGLTAFGFHIDGIVLTYDRSNASTAQVLATLPSVSVNLMGLNTVAATGPPAITTSVTIGQNGFTLGDLTTTLSNIRIGGFLEFTSLTVSLSSIAYTQGAANAAGSFGFSNATAKMYPGQSALKANLTGVDGSLALSGQSVWSITADLFTAAVGEAFAVSQANVTLQYTAGDPNSQDVLTLTNTAIAPVQFSGLSSVNRTLVFRSDGVDFGSFSMTGAAVTIDQYLAFTGLTLDVASFGLNYAAGGPGSTFTGFITTTFGTIKFFPTANFLQLVPEGIVTGYDFFDHTSSGEFTISMTKFTLTLSTMLKIETENVIIQPGRTTIMTLETAKITSPKLAWLEATISDLVVTRTGFNIGSLDLGTAPGEVVSLPANAGTLTGVHFHVIDLAYDINAGLSGSVSLTVDRLVLMPGDPSFSLVATDLFGGYVTTPTGASELTLTAGRVEAILHPQEIHFVAVNIVFTPEASRILEIGNVTVGIDLGGTILEGSGGNFAINSDGSFEALPGFGVSFSLSTAPALLRFPGFLQIGLTKLGLSWPDFNADKGNFDLILSAFVTSLGTTPGGPTVTGVINDLRISLSELRAGRMPIIDVGSGSITISGPLFGGTVSGTIAIGVIRLDANGSRIDPTDTTTAVAQRVFFGAIRASFTFAGRSGFSLSFGVSELGPISAYMAIHANVLLHAPSGLTLKSLHAEVVFDSTLPDLTEASELDPDNGDELGFTPIAALTDAQWLQRLELAVVNQANAPPSGDFWSAFSRTMVIKGRAEFRSAGSPEEVFRASVDILFSTDGKMMVNGIYTLADKLDVQGRIYADLRDPANAVFLFFARYAPNGGTELVFLGKLELHITSSLVEFQITGSVKFKKALVNPTIVGTILLSYANDQLYMRITGSLKLKFIGDVIGVDGIFHLDLRDTNNPQFWGALNIQTNLGILENLGIYATGSVYFRVNTTNIDRTETLTVPGQPAPVTVSIAAQTLSILMTGSVKFKRGGVDWFVLTGEYGYEISSTRAIAVLGGKLLIGPTGSPFLTLDINGFLQIDDRGIAAQAQVVLAPNLPQITGMTLGGSFTFQLNTLGTAVTFSVPGGTYTIPAAPPNISGATAGPYAIIYGSAQVVLGDGAVAISASDLRFVLTTTGIVQLNMVGIMLFKVNSLTLFTYEISGGFQVDSAGVAAVLNAGFTASNGGSFGFSAATTSATEFRLNTTNQVRTIGTTTLVAGTYASVTADMNFVVGGITLGGRFTVTAGATQFTVLLAAGVGAASFKAGSTTILSFSFTAGFSIINENAANRGLVLLGAVSLSSNTASLGFGFGGSVTFTLMLNTTSSARTLGSTTLAAQTFMVKTAAGSALTIAGVAFAVSMEFTAGASGVRLQISGDFELKVGNTRIFQFLVIGAVNIDAAGVAAILAVTQGVEAAGGMDFAAGNIFILEINTTNQVRNFASAPRADGTTTPVSLAAGPYVRVAMGGFITILGVQLGGSAMITVTSGFVAIQFAGNFSVKSGGTVYFNFTLSGTLYVSATGVAARIGLTLDAGPSSGGFGLSGTNFSLELNTTGAQIVLGSGETFAAGPYFRITVTGSLSLPGITIDGSYTLTVGADSLSMAIVGNITLSGGGMTFFTFNVAGGLVVESSGIAAVLSLSRQTDFSLFGFSYNLTFRLEVNTTNQARTITLPAGNVLLEAGVYGRVRAFGSFNMGGFSLEGSFMLQANLYRGLVVSVTATVNIIGVTAGVSGDFAVTSQGMWGTLALSMGGLSGPGYSLTGTFTLGFNTANVYIQNNVVGVLHPRSYTVTVSGATLQLLGLTLKGSVRLGIENGTFFIEIPSYSPLQISFYNFGVVGVSGRIDSNGNFRLTGSLFVAVGLHALARVSGYVTVTMSNTGLSGSFAGDFWLLNTRVATVSGSVSAGLLTISSAIGFTVPGINLTLRGQLDLTVGNDPVLGPGLFGSFTSYLSGGGRLFGGINVTGSIYINTWFNLVLITAGFSVRIGGENLGASLEGSVTISNHTSLNGIYLKGRAWGGAHILGVWVGLAISVTLQANLEGKASIEIDLGVLSVYVPVNLGGIFQSLGSNISGGYAFVDVNGNGTWDPTTEARAPVDGDGNFSFNVGDASVWRVDATNTFGFADLDGNGVWDPATEARVVLVNGALPASVVPPAPALPGTLATNPLFRLGLLQAYGIVDANGIPEVDPTQGQVVARGGSTIDLTNGALTPHTGARSLGMLTAGFTGLAGAGQVVFFDTNNNSILDAGEVSVTANNNGFYTFMPGQDQLASLGILAGYDLNGNGIIDTNEGSIVLAGGTDKNNGLPIDTITRISAANFGSGLGLAAQPLASLQHILVTRGHSVVAANARLALVFGLPPGLSLDTIDPRTDPGLSAAERTAILRVTSQLETYILTTGYLLVSAGVSATNAQQAALDALADRVLQNYNPATAALTIAPADMVDFTDLATMTALLTAAATKAGVSPVAATRDAVAQVTRELNLRAAAYAATSADLTRDLARIDAIAKGALEVSIGDLVAGRTTVTAFLNAYSGATLDALLAGVALTAVTPPTLTGVTDITVATDVGVATLNVHLATTTGLASEVTLTASSSNPAFLPNTAIVVVGSGADRTLAIDSTGLAPGSTTITLTATLNGQVTTQTLVYTLTLPAPIPPLVVTTPATVVVAGDFYLYSFISFPALSNRTVVVTASGVPAWLNFTDHGDGTATLLGTPALADLAGASATSYSITVTATDNTGAATRQTFTLMLVESLLSVPSFNSVPAGNTVAVGAVFTYDVDVSPGAGATSVTLTSPNLPAWLTLTDHGNGTATLTGIPATANLGALLVTLVATDNLGLTSTQIVDLTVQAAPPPVFTSSATGSATAGDTFTRVVTATPSSPATSVTFTATGLPAWLTLTNQGGTATLSGTPTLNQIGSFSFTLTATNNLGVTSTQSFTVSVTPALSLAAIGDVTMAEDTSRAVTLSLSGGSAVVVVTATNNTVLPAGGMVVTGSGATRTLTLTSAANQSGTTTVTVTLIEGGLTVSQSFTVMVTPTDDPVVPTGLVLPEFSVRAGSPDLAVDLSAYFGSADGVVTFTATGSDASLAGVSVTGNILAISPNAARSGVNVITVTATSVGAATGQVYTVTGTIRLTVVPELSIAPAQIVRTAAGNVMRFVVTLLTPSNQTVRVGYATQNGTALAGMDYVAAGGTLEFAPGATQQIIDVALVGGLLLNPASFNLGLSGAQNAVIGTSSASGLLPVDRSVLVGLRLSFSFVEFDSDSSASGGEQEDELVLVGGEDTASVQLGTIGSSEVSLGGQSGNGTDLNLEYATSLEALATVHDIPQY
jgi:hypothetical protein